MKEWLADFHPAFEDGLDAGGGLERAQAFGEVFFGGFAKLGELGAGEAALAGSGWLGTGELVGDALWLGFYGVAVQVKEEPNGFAGVFSPSGFVGLGRSGARNAKAEEDGLGVGFGGGFAGEGFEGVVGQSAGELGMLADKVFVFESEFFGSGGFAFEAFVDFADGIEVVVGAKQFAAFDAEGSGDDEGFVVHAVVEVEEGVEFVGRQEVPKDDFAAGMFEVGLGLAELFFDAGIEAAVNSAYALHEADGIPVEIEVNERRSASWRLRPSARTSVAMRMSNGFLRWFGVVVEGGESVDDFAALFSGAGSVDAFYGGEREVFMAELDF